MDALGALRGGIFIGGPAAFSAGDVVCASLLGSFMFDCVESARTAMSV